MRSIKLPAVVMMAVLLAGGSMAAAAIVLVPDPSGLQEASIRINPGPAIVADSAFSGAASIVSQSPSVSWGPDSAINTGAASLTTNINTSAHVITGVGSLSATARFNDAGDVLVDADSLITLYFDVVDDPTSLQLSGSVTLNNNEFTPGPAVFWIYDSTLTTNYFTATLPDPNGTASFFTAQTLGVGSYELVGIVLTEASANAGDLGPNTATGSFNFTFLIPEPASAMLLLVGALPLLRRRR